MANDPKLKEYLMANIPKKVVMQSCGKPYPQKDFKTGAPKFHDDGSPVMSYMYFFTEGQNKYVHFANEVEEQTLSAYNPGDTLQVLKLEKKQTGKPSYFIYQWSEPGSAEGNIQPEPTPTQTRKLNDSAKKHKIKERMISYAGLFQSYVIASNGNMPDSELIEHGIEFASKASKAIIERALHDILQEES